MDLYVEKVMIRNMVVTLRNVASSNSLNWKMKHFYESCMNLDNIEMDEGKPLKKIISTKLGMFCSLPLSRVVCVIIINIMFFFLIDACLSYYRWLVRVERFRL